MDVRTVGALERFDPAKMAKVNLFETPRFFCDVYCLKPGQSQKVHTHDESDKVYFVLRGKLQATVGAETRAIKAGEAVLAPAGEPHGVLNDSPEDATCLVFMAPHPRLGR